MTPQETYLNNALQTIEYLSDVVFITDAAFRICGRNRQAARMRPELCCGQTITEVFEPRFLTEKQIHALIEQQGCIVLQVKPNAFLVQNFLVSRVVSAEYCYYCWQEESRLPRLLSEEKRLYRREMQWIGNHPGPEGTPAADKPRTEWAYGVLRCTKNQFESQLYTSLKYRQTEKDIQPVDLRRMLRICAAYLEQGGGARLVLETGETEEPLFVAADELYFQQALAYLIANAYEAAGETGTVWLRCLQEERRAIVEVEDDGPGIPEEDRRKIWEPLFTGKDDRLGMGLPLARLLTEEMGGRLDLCPAETGARFRMEFPVLENWQTVREIPQQYAEEFYRNHLDLTAILAEPCRQEFPFPPAF